VLKLEFLHLFARNWFPLLLYLVVLPPMIAGLYGHAFDLPYLFRDDPQLRSYGLEAILRNSPAIWGLAAATLFILAIWTRLFLVEEMCGSQRDDLRGFVRFLVR
jgi:hypothetical protein